MSWVLVTASLYWISVLETLRHPMARRLMQFPVMCRETLQWRHNGRDSVSNHQPHDCLLNRLSRRRSKKTSKLCVTGLCAGNSPGTGEFPAQMAINAENVSIWWRHHGTWNAPSYSSHPASVPLFWLPASAGNHYTTRLVRRPAIYTATQS